MVESNDKTQAPGFFGLLGYLALGAYFGLVLAKSEAISWFRIQEMFRFQSFRMYGLLGSAVVVAMLSLAPKEKTPWLRRYWLGGTLFGMGWALLGACPGPLYTLIGYGVLRNRLPH